MNFRNSWRVFLVLSALFLSPRILSAQEAILLSVEDAVRYASSNNVSIQQQKIVLEQAEKTKDSAWGVVIPSVNLGGNLSMPYLEENTDYAMSWTGSVSLTLTPSLYSAIKAAILQYENGELNYEQALRRIELSVRQSFYGLLYAQESIKMLERNIETAQKQYEQASRRYSLGQTSELEMLQSRLNYEQLLPNLESAQLSFRNNLATLKQLLGIPQSQRVELSGSLADSANFGEIVLDYNIDDTPSVKSAQKNIEIVRNSLLASRFSAYGPRVTASFTYGQSKTKMSQKYHDDMDALAASPNPLIRQQASNRVSEDWAESKSSAFSLGVSIPLDGYLPWSTNGRGVSQAKSNIENAELALSDTKVTVEIQIENYLAQIKQINSQLSMLRSTVEVAQKSYDMTRAAYNQGARDLLMLQTAADQLLQANVNLAAQEYQLIVAVLNLENVLGVQFGTLGR